MKRSGGIINTHQPYRSVFMSQSDNYYLFGRKPLQYAVIDPVSCTGCGW